MSDASNLSEPNDSLGSSFKPENITICDPEQRVTIALDGKSISMRAFSWFFMADIINTLAPDIRLEIEKDRARKAREKKEAESKVVLFRPGFSDWGDI